MGITVSLNVHDQNEQIIIRFGNVVKTKESSFVPFQQNQTILENNTCTTLPGMIIVVHAKFAPLDYIKNYRETQVFCTHRTSLFS